jgi:predicted DNA-binding transcriptional regulator AlpA
LSERASAWPESQVQLWIRQRIAGSRTDTAA